MLKDGSLLKIKNFVELMNGNLVVIGSKYKALKNFYSLGPFDSRTIGIQIIDQSEAIELKCFRLSDIKCKVWKMPYKNKFVVFPLHNN